MGFEGSFKEFLEMLRTEKRFYYDTKVSLGMIFILLLLLFFFSVVTCQCLVAWENPSHANLGDSN